MWNFSCKLPKKKLLLITIFFFLSLTAVIHIPAVSAENELPAINVYLRDGTVIKSGHKPYGPPETSSLSSPVAENMRLKTVNTGMIEAIMNNRKIQTGWNEILSDVSEIEFLSTGLSPYKNGILRLKRKNGATLDLGHATLLKYAGHDLPVKELVIYTYDGFNKLWREENLDISKVSRIVIVNNIITAPPVPVVHATSAVTFEKKPAYNKKAAKASSVTVRFEPGIEEVDPEYHTRLKAIASALKNTSNKKRKIYITGHTDFDKDKKRSIETSKARAEAVKDFLVKKAGVPASRINVAYMGDKKPAATNKTPEGRSKNRRVEIVLK